jgi:translation initiation factor 3 subunit J
MQSDWEASSEDEEKPAPAVAPAPPKKKGTLKAKLAEKVAQKAALKEVGEEDTDYDSDEVLDPREKAKQDREKELKADLHNAAELFGAAALGGTSTWMLPKS